MRLQVFGNRHLRLLREARVNWDLKHGLVEEGSLLIESIPSGWLNVLLSSIWPSLLERFFSHLAADRLEKAFRKRITMMPNKFPWKHLTQVKVEHVTLGLTSPQFQVATTGDLLNVCDAASDHHGKIRAVDADVAIGGGHSVDDFGFSSMDCMSIGWYGLM